MNQYKILQKIKESYQDILQQKLVGIYVHGSIAFQCFNWDKSDIDFLVVISEPLTQEEKEALITVLLELDAYCPPKGLEMSVVPEEACKPFQYPTPFELHFSNSHKEKYLADLSEYCRHMNGTDKDLAAHFTVICAVGEVLCGKSVTEVFGEVPRSDYIDSIKFDVEDAAEGIHDNPVYYVLNLCRVLAYLEDSKVLSKKQGGEWGIHKLPKEYRFLIERALACYGGSDIMNVSEEILSTFAEYMRERGKI